MIGVKLGLKFLNNPNYGTLTTPTSDPSDKSDKSDSSDTPKKVPPKSLTPNF